MSEHPTPAANQPILELRVALTSGEYARLLRFYQDGLGLAPAQFWTSEQGHGVLFVFGQAAVEIFDETYAQEVDQIEAGRRVSGPIRFALQVPDLQAALDRALAYGATLVHPPIITPWGDHNVRIQDPDGLQITLFQVINRTGEE